MFHIIIIQICCRIMRLTIPVAAIPRKKKTPGKGVYLCTKRLGFFYIHPISPNTTSEMISTPNMMPSVMSLFFIFFMSCTTNAIVKNGR